MSETGLNVLKKKKKNVTPEWGRKVEPSSDVKKGDHVGSSLFDCLGAMEGLALKKSRAAALQARNELEVERAKLQVERAKRELQVLKDVDVSGETKRYATRVRADIERSMVSIEKTHALLRRTDNLPGESCGFAETVVSGGSISPNSSISEAEVRQVQKDNADLNESLEKEKKKMSQCLSVLRRWVYLRILFRMLVSVSGLSILMVLLIAMLR